MKKFITIFVIIMLYGFDGSAQTKVGITAANFLTIPVGARPSAMGGAFVAIANDANAAFWNPAGLSRLQQSSISASYSNWLVGTKLSWVSVAVQLKNIAIGLSLNQLDYGEEEITTPMNPNGTGQKWGAQDMAIAFSFAMSLTDRFSFGATAKYVQQQIWHENAHAFAFDAGLLFRTQLDGLSIGMNIANFGTEMKLDGKDLLQPVDIDPANSGNTENIVAKLETDSWSLPLYFTVGLGYEAIKRKNWALTIAADATHPNNQKPFINIGAECDLSNLILLRAGYNSLFKEAAEEGLTMGAGFQYDFNGVALNIDYGYMDFGVFDNISRYSVTLKF